MGIFNNLLVLTDFSPSAANAFLFSLRLAEKWKSVIKLLYIISPEYGTTKVPVTVDLAIKEYSKAAMEKLRKFKNKGLQEANVKVKVTTEVKSCIQPNTAICLVEKVDNIDLIVIGTNGENSTWENSYGSNAGRVVKQSHCSVLVVPEDFDYHGIKTVVFAADLHEIDPHYILQACKLMEPFHPVIRCVHIEKESQLRVEKLESFFLTNAMNLQITFHNFEEESDITSLEALTNKWDVNLLVMTSYYKEMFSQIFHESLTKQMSLHMPLLVLN